jgi:hypothetical protein
MTAPPGPKVGRSLLRVDPDGWSAHPIAVPGAARPIDVRASPDGRQIWVLDFGHFEMLGEGRVDARPGSGAIHTATLA